MDRLTPLDAWFLHVEDGIDHMHMALVSVFEPTCPDFDAILADVDARLDRIPRYRQRVRRFAGGLVAPMWADDPEFDVTNHVKRARVRSPGSDEMLSETVGELISDEIDRHHPLWEIYVIEGLAGGRWATLQKVHHCLTDGVGGAELSMALVDPTADYEPPKRPDWSPSAEPPTWRIVRDEALRHAHPVRALRTLAGTPRRTARLLYDSVSGFRAFAHDVLPTPKTVLNGPLGPVRLWWPATTSMDDVRRVRKHHDVTVNDVALTVICGGLRDLLVSHGEATDRAAVRSLIPVSLRETDRDGALHNRVATMVADLPVHVADPLERLQAVHEHLQILKASHETQATANVVEASAHLPFLPISIAFHGVTAALHTFVQRNVNTVTTNVPGPPIPLYWMGRRIERAYPVTPIGESVRLGVAIFSYLDHLTFGVTADRSAIPNGHLVAAGIERDMATLTAAVGSFSP